MNFPSRQFLHVSFSFEEANSWNHLHRVIGKTLGSATILSRLQTPPCSLQADDWSKGAIDTGRGWSGVLGTLRTPRRFSDVFSISPMCSRFKVKRRDWKRNLRTLTPPPVPGVAQFPCLLGMAWSFNLNVHLQMELNNCRVAPNDS